ncbi:MAG TPA: hypothetical protein PKL29_03230 [Methanothrix sp.]|nr:hypothetical protein [Methanothrix sp.]
MLEHCSGPGPGGEESRCIRHGIAWTGFSPGPSWGDMSDKI